MFNRFVSAGLVLGFLFLLTVPVAAADGPPWTHERDGVILGFNGGFGSAALSVDGDDSDRETGGAGNLRVAYAFRPDLALGGEFTAWTREIDDVTWTFTVGAATLTWYSEGFFARGGFGVGTAEAEISFSSGTLTFSDSGIGFFGAVGHEWRLTRRFALGPQFDFSWMDVGDGVSANYFNLTVGLNWYL